MIPTGFTEDKYVQIAEARPGNPAVVHHIIAFIREPGNPWLKDAKPGVPFVPRERAAPSRKLTAEQGEQNRDKADGGGFGDFLAGYAPGTLPNVMKPGQAKLVKAGSDIVLQMHYTANGKATTDISRIGIMFATDKADRARADARRRQRRTSPFLPAIRTIRWISKMTCRTTPR